MVRMCFGVCGHVMPYSNAERQSCLLWSRGSFNDFTFFCTKTERVEERRGDVR